MLSIHESRVKRRLNAISGFSGDALLISGGDFETQRSGVRSTPYYASWRSLEGGFQLTPARGLPFPSQLCYNAAQTQPLLEGVCYASRTVRQRRQVHVT